MEDTRLVVVAEPLGLQLAAGPGVGHLAAEVVDLDVDLARGVTHPVDGHAQSAVLEQGQLADSLDLQLFLFGAEAERVVVGVDHGVPDRLTSLHQARRLNCQGRGSDDGQDGDGGVHWSLSGWGLPLLAGPLVYHASPLKQANNARASYSRASLAYFNHFTICLCAIGSFRSTNIFIITHKTV